MNYREEVELTLLALCIYGDNSGAIFTALSEEAFSDPSARGAYAKAKRMWKENGSITTALLFNLCDTEEETACKYSANYFYPSLEADTYIKALNDLNSLQQVATIADELKIAQSMDEVSEIESKLQKVTRGSVKSKSITYEDYMDKFLTRKTTALVAYQSGFSKLDNYLVISPGDFVILAGEQSSGKTAFSLELMNRFAKRGHRCAYFSLETEEYKLGDRAFCNFANLDFNHVKRQDLDGDDWEKASENMDAFRKLPVSIVPSSGRTVDWIKAEALRQEAEIIFIDYLGLISPSKGSKDKSYEIATNISKELHTLAQSEKITVIALQQQNRDKVGSASMHSLRDSSQLESDADAILILTIPKDDYGKTERDKSMEYMPRWEEELHIAKNKDGDRVTIPLIFDGQHQRFYEMETRYD